MFRLQSGLRLRFAAMALAIGAPFAFASAANAEKSGQLCAKAKVGTTAKDASGAKLTCTVDGARSRWVGGASTPAATKLAPAAAKTKTTKAPAAATPAAAKTAKTTKPSSGSTGAAGSAVKGRFCAKADDGKRDSNAKGEKLVCRADASGKNR